MASGWENTGSLERFIAAETDSPQLAIVRRRSCSGGCIHYAEIVELADGRTYFVKTGHKAADMFAQEACGLHAIAASQTLRTPAVVGTACLDEQQACLVLEAIEPHPRAVDFWEVFGRNFASLHRRSTAADYGWSSDNYLGLSPQPNACASDWPTFFAERRLRLQLRLARNRSLGSHELFKLVERIASRADSLLRVEDCRPALLHGDLWSGNFLVGSDGQAVVIDPAVYYGHREADLAMPYLFGGFSEPFFAAYQEDWPLEPGWQERVELYKLYHLLNHLNLFGSGYLESCLEIARRFA